VPVPEVIRYLSDKLAQVRPPGEEELASGSSVAVSRYEEGLTADTEFEGELVALGYSGARLNNLLLQGILRRQLALYRDRLALWRQQVKDGILAPSELYTLMEREGVGADVVEMERQRMESQTPTQPVLSTEVTLSVLEIEEIPARPVAVASTVSLAILGAERVVEVPVVVLSSEVSLAVLGVEVVEEVPVVLLSSEVTLAVLAAEVVVEVPVEVLSTEITLGVLGVEEVPPPAPEVSAEITLAILESEEV